MRASILITFIAATTVAVLSAPSSNLQGLNSLVEISRTPIYRPNDYLSDLIRIITGRDVTAFITLIHDTTKALEELAKEVQLKLIEILVPIEGNAKAEIQAILNGAIGEAKSAGEHIVRDLYILMPAITATKPHFADVAELIKMLLGKTLEQFLIEVGTAILRIEDLLNETIIKILTIAESVAHEVSGKIRALASETLWELSNLIEPILDVLRKCIDL